MPPELEAATPVLLVASVVTLSPPSPELPLVVVSVPPAPVEVPPFCPVVSPDDEPMLPSSPVVPTPDPLVSPSVASSGGELPPVLQEAATTSTKLKENLLMTRDAISWPTVARMERLDQRILSSIPPDRVSSPRRHTRTHSPEWTDGYEAGANRTP